MKKANLIGDLLELPGRLAAAEEAYLEAAQHHAEARLALEARESDLILLGLEGRNEAERKARLFVGTGTFQEAVTGTAAEKERCAAALRCLQVEASCLRAVARLIGGADDA